MRVQRIQLKIIITSLIINSTFCLAENDTLPTGIQFDASYVTDQFYNFSGGIKPGYAYMGMIDLGMGIGTEKLGLWSGGEFYFQIENTHGISASGELIGDAQVASNIDNGDYTYLYLAQFYQDIGKLRIWMGIQDLNAEFLFTENSGNLINSSFGIMPSSSLNMPVPIFPKPALGFGLKYQLTKTLGVQSILFDGDPLSLDDDRYNIRHELDVNEGYLSVTELHYTHTFGNLNGTYKLGFQYHSSEFINYNDTSQTQQGINDIYLLINQDLISTNNKYLGAFVQAGAGDKNYNINSLYLGAGITASGFLCKKRDDALTIGIASAKLHAGQYNHYDNETVIELNYYLQIHQNIAIQPDLQYIINPGINPALNDAFVGMLRISFSN